MGWLDKLKNKTEPEAAPSIDDENIPVEPGHGNVYLLLEEGGEYLKLGKSINIDRRLKELGRLSPRPLHMVALLDGYSYVESWFHRKFAHLRAHGEWFHFRDELAETVNQIIEGKTSAILCPSALVKDGFNVEQQAVEEDLDDYDDAKELLRRKRLEVEKLWTKVQRRKGRTSLAEFVKQAWAILQPGVTLEWWENVDALCFNIQCQLEDHFKACADPSFVMRAQNLLINCPPRSLKSFILAVANVWAWLHRPEMKILYLSSNPRVAEASGRLVRDLVQHPWFQETYEPTWVIRRDMDALSKLGNTSGGVRETFGLESRVTGAGCVAGDTLIATEIGQVPIVNLQHMNPRPRVWSMNVRTGEVELKPILDWKLSGYKKTVAVRTSTGHMLQCTDDHKIWTSQGYTEAARVRGSAVSILQWPDGVSSRSFNPMQSMRDHHGDVRPVQGAIQDGWRRTRQKDTEGVQDFVLQFNLSGVGSASSASPMPNVQPELRSRVQQEDLLFPDLFRSLSSTDQSEQDSGGQTLCFLLDDDEDQDKSPNVLFQAVPEPSSQRTHDGDWKLELQRQGQGLLRWSVGEHGSVDSSTGRPEVHRLPGDEEVSGTRRASYRRGREQQQTGESDHALRLVPQHTPQVQGATVLSTDVETERGCDQEIPVYDISVEGNNNFFANSILIHNSTWLIIDDPHDLKDTQVEIQTTNENYKSAVHNRINDPRTSIRTGIMQRVKVYDWAAKMLESGDWLHVRIPMEFEVDSDCICGKCHLPNVYGWKDWRTEEGEIMHPRFTKEFLAKELERLEQHGYNGQMQQRPEEPGGGRIKAEFWKFCRIADHHAGGWPRPQGCQGTKAGEVPEEPYVIRREKNGRLVVDSIELSIDPAAKKTDRGSLYGMLAIAWIGERFFVLDDRSTRGEFTVILDVLRSMIIAWRPKRLLIEGKAAGGPIIETLKEEFAQGKIKDPVTGQAIICPIEEIEPEGDKEARLDSCLPRLRSRHGHLLEGAPWVKEFVKEHSNFPNYVTADRVDSLSQSLNHTRGSGNSLYRIPM